MSGGNLQCLQLGIVTENVLRYLFKLVLAQVPIIKPLHYKKKIKNMYTRKKTIIEIKTFE